VHSSPKSTWRARTSAAEQGSVITQSGATYLFDLASAVGAGQEDRTVAAWTVTPATVSKRDCPCQRGFPLAADPGSPLG
jgi:hypothetical protein